MSVVGAIKDFLTWPFRAWSGTECLPFFNQSGKYNYGYDPSCTPTEPNHAEAAFAGFVVLIVLAVVAAIAYVLGKWAYGRIYFALNARPCQHIDCGHKRTLDVGTGEPGCIKGEACCGNCQGRHKHDAVKRRAEAEPKRLCLGDQAHGNMQKVIQRGIIIDKCPFCKSVYLDGGELEIIKKREFDRGYNSGDSDGFFDGFLVGVITG